MYNKTIFNVLQRQERPSEFDADQETIRATWDTANQDPYGVLFFITASSAFSVVRRFQSKGSRTRTTGVGSPSREIRRVFAGSNLVEHIRMTSTRMRPGQDPDDDYLYHMDSCQGRLNACDPPEGPTNRQYEDIIIQALP